MQHEARSMIETIIARRDIFIEMYADDIIPHIS
jgi:hypothetical protein